MEDYHNTVPEEGERLQGYKEKAKDQNKMVLEVFQWNAGRGFTPVEVQVILEEWGHKILLTSVRRSITNLTKARRLIKIGRDQVKVGLYGHNNRLWRFNTEYMRNLATGK